MPKPAYIDTSLYLPLGGINGYEVNGFAVNGVGFVESPFAVGTFALDPYRSILPGEPQNADLRAVLPSFLTGESNLSVQRSAEDSSVLWAARNNAEMAGDRQASSEKTQERSMAIEVESISIVPAEYRTSCVLASYPASITSTTSVSDVDAAPSTQKESESNVSTVPAEDRTTKVRRI
jgi:hypothetical protein